MGRAEPAEFGDLPACLAQLPDATESSAGAVPQFHISGRADCEAETGGACRSGDIIGVDRGVPGGRMVAHGVEMSAVRKDIWEPAVDATLHQLRVEQG